MYSQINIEDILIRYFVKYDTLDSLISYAFEGSNENSLNIFIDLYGLYHTIYSRNFRTNIIDYTSFTSSIINMCVHYRSYFRGLGVHTKIFLISSFNLPKTTLENIPYYNKTMTEKIKNNIVSDAMDLNLNLLELLCPYLPDIFFIKTDFESAVIMNEIIDRERTSENKCIPALIVSTDIYPIQLCAIKENVSYIWPRKIHAEDISLICPNFRHSEFINNFWSIITHKIGNSMSTEKVRCISPSNLMLLLALNHFKDRDLPVIVNMTKAKRIISEVIGFNSMKLTMQSLFDMNPKIHDELDFPTVNYRYLALDIPYQSLVFKESVENTTLHYENLQDPGAVRMINDQYFTNNPIDILRI